MKTLAALVLFLSSFSTFASNSVGFYTIRTNAIMSEFDLAHQCTKDVEQAEEKLTEISTRLTGNADTLIVAGLYGWTSNTPTFPTQPDGNNEFYCVLKFTSLDPTVHFAALSTASFIHLAKDTWDTACEPAYDSAIANQDSPVSIYWKSWSMIQGRMCEVTTVTTTKSY